MMAQSTPSSESASGANTAQSRFIVDATVGQDETITGVMLRRVVGTTDAVVQLWEMVYFMGPASISIEPNVNFP